jgi:hypothetical protein
MSRINVKRISNRSAAIHLRPFRGVRKLGRNEIRFWLLSKCVVLPNDGAHTLSGRVDNFGLHSYGGLVSRR